MPTYFKILLPFTCVAARDYSLNLFTRVYTSLLAIWVKKARTRDPSKDPDEWGTMTDSIDHIPSTLMTTARWGVLFLDSHLEH